MRLIRNDWFDYEGSEYKNGYGLIFEANAREGDSGAPVWNKTTGKVIGILSTAFVSPLFNRVDEVAAIPLITLRTYRRRKFPVRSWP
jgi:V8-like Glu-specific endopeptidase